jgi:hypothetical protein
VQSDKEEEEVGVTSVGPDGDNETTRGDDAEDHNAMGATSGFGPV